MAFGDKRRRRKAMRAIDKRALDVLSYARLGQASAVETALWNIGADYGRGGIERTLLVLCDAYVYALGIPSGPNVIQCPVWVDMVSGKVVDVANLPEAVRWAGWLIAARVAMDKMGCESLLGSVADEQLSIGTTALLHIVSSTLDSANAPILHLQR